MPRQNTRTSAQLTRHVGELTDFSTALIALAELVPERTTLGQITFFLLAGIADIKGSAATFTEIKEAVGPAVNRSLHTTYRLFLDRPSRRSDTGKSRDGLGWLYREENPDDNRQKFLKLTDAGRLVLAEVVEAMNGASPTNGAQAA